MDALKMKNEPAALQPSGRENRSQSVPDDKVKTKDARPPDTEMDETRKDAMPETASRPSYSIRLSSAPRALGRAPTT
jgi:hypothetical protein